MWKSHVGNLLIIACGKGLNSFCLYVIALLNRNLYEHQPVGRTQNLAGMIVDQVMLPRTVMTRHALLTLVYIYPIAVAGLPRLYFVKQPSQK